MAECFVPDKPIYYVTQDSTYGVTAAWIPGAVTPVTLSLVTRDHQALGRALETHQQGANLVICMGKEGAAAIFSEIRKLARTMGWPLPKEDEDLA